MAKKKDGAPSDKLVVHDHMLDHDFKTTKSGFENIKNEKFVKGTKEVMRYTIKGEKNSVPAGEK